MNIFDVSHAMMTIEDSAKEAGLNERQCVLFFMWLAEDKYPGHNFDDAFVSKVLSEMATLVKEHDEWAHKEAMESLKSSLLEPC